MRSLRPSHAIFAVTLLAYGLYGLIKGEFATPWDSAPKNLPAREVLAYLCDLISICAGAGLLWRRTAPAAARLLLLSFLSWLLCIKVYYIVLAPTSEGPYQSWGETAVLAAAAWLIYVWLATAWDQRRLGFMVGDTGVRVAQTMYGLALIAFGLSHFAYLELTAPLVPDWLLWPVGWAYFTGAAYLAAGLAIIVRILAPWAAWLVALQMALITVFVWIPLGVSGRMTAFQVGETLYSILLTFAAWVIADAYRRSVSVVNAR